MQINVPFLESLEPIIEVTNLALALVIAFVSIVIFRKLLDKPKKAWAYLILGVSIFVLHELVGFLDAYNFFSITGLYAFTEFLFVIAFFIAIFVFKNFFKEISEGNTKSITLKK